jgi:hypothetical protein
VDSPIHALGGRSSGVGSMSRAELRPGARPFVPQRDLLVGGPSDQRRHRLARVALLGHLLRESMVQHAFDNWLTRYGLRQPLEMLTTRLDTLAFDAGLSSRTALFALESTVDASTQQAVHGAYEAFWVGVNGNGVELVRDGHRLAEQLVTALGLSAGCIPWLTWELLSWFCDSVRAQIEDPRPSPPVNMAPTARSSSVPILKASWGRTWWAPVPHRGVPSCRPSRESPM